MRYYLLINNNFVGIIDETEAGYIALPLLRTDNAMSLMNEQHVSQLMANLNLTPVEALAALGIVDVRGNAVKSVFVAPQIVSLRTVIEGPTYKLIDIGEFSLWQVDAPVANLLALHFELWTMQPTLTLGALAVVLNFGVSFSPDAVRVATGMTIPQALARRDRIAAYLEAHGYPNTAALRVATTEHAQMAGICTALGYTMEQLWEAMVL